MTFFSPPSLNPSYCYCERGTLFSISGLFGALFVGRALKLKIASDDVGKKRGSKAGDVLGKAENGKV